MSTIILGVDLDEVVFSYLNGLRRAMEKEGITPPIDDPEFYSLFQSGWFESEEQFRLVHGRAVDDGLYTNLELIPEARKTLWELSHAGYKIDIITSRFVNPGQHHAVVTQTALALESNRIPHDNLSFLSDKSRYNTDCFIDDSPKNIMALQAAGKETITFNLRYNEGISGPRAMNWSEVREMLLKKFGK